MAPPSAKAPRPPSPLLTPRAAGRPPSPAAAPSSADRLRASREALEAVEATVEAERRKSVAADAVREAEEAKRLVDALAALRRSSLRSAGSEGDAFSDAAAQGCSRDAALDQALSGALREGLSGSGVIREAEGLVSNRRNDRPVMAPRKSNENLN